MYSIDKHCCIGTTEFKCIDTNIAAKLKPYSKILQLLNQGSDTERWFREKKFKR